MLIAFMSLPANTVSIHPYFKAHPGKAEAFRGLLSSFIEKTTPEPGNLYYEFTSNGDEFFCREGYIGAAGVLAHLDNVGALIGEALKVSELTRLEIHGPADDLAQLREPLAPMGAAFFTLECRGER